MRGVMDLRNRVDVLDDHSLFDQYSIEQGILFLLGFSKAKLRKKLHSKRVEKMLKYTRFECVFSDVS